MNEEITEVLLIPRERVGVLIGKKGEVRRRLEKLTGTKITIDSESGEVSVMRFSDKDPLAALKALDIIKAIGRGFSPQKAFKLANDNTYFELIDLTEQLGNSSKTLARVRARIIGRSGKAEKYISHLTSTDLVVFGKTVAIIGDAENVALAKQAVLRLVEGLPHNVVFRFLERQHKKL